MEAELSDAGFFLGTGYLFRWYHSPGSRMEHRYRNVYSVIADVENATYEPLADDADVSADADRLMDLSEEYCARRARASWPPSRPRSSMTGPGTYSP